MGKKILYVLIILLVFVLAWYTLSIARFNGEIKESGQINLTYQAEEEFDPDMAIMALGVETTNKSLDQAFRENNQKIDQITTRLKESFNDLIITTLNFRVSPRYEKVNEEQVLYYNVTNQLEVKLSKLTRIGEIIQQAVSSGANQVLSIRYIIEDVDQAQETVTKKALVGIRQKAEFITRELGKESYSIVSMDINDQQFARNYLNMRTESADLAAPKTVIPPISPQQIKITVNINASFSLE